GEFLMAEADQVGVLGVEFVHEPLGRRRLMLGNFLDEGLVIEPVNLLEFPILARAFEHQRFLCAHNFVCSGLDATSRRASSAAISSAKFRRCANKIIAATAVMRVAVNPARWNHPSASGRQT